MADPKQTPKEPEVPVAEHSDVKTLKKGESVKFASGNVYTAN